MFKINISEKSGKTYKLEVEAEALIEKALHDKVQGKDISPGLEGYEFEIAGASDKSGFPALKDVEGFGKRKVLLTYGKAMKKRPRREGKRKLTTPTPKGLRLRKTVRGKIISSEIIQINLKVLKEGSKKLSEIFPEQAKIKDSSSSSDDVERNKQKEVEKKPEEKTEKPAKEESSAPKGEQGGKTPVTEAPKEEIKPEEKKNE